MFKSLPDNSLMLTPSEGRPPMFYIAIGKILAMAAVHSLTSITSNDPEDQRWERAPLLVTFHVN